MEVKSNPGETLEDRIEEEISHTLKDDVLEVEHLLNYDFNITMWNPRNPLFLIQPINYRWVREQLLYVRV